MGANNYTAYNTSNGSLAADNEASALDTGTVVISSGGTAESATIPEGARLIRLQSDRNFWYNFNTTAVVPTGDDVSGSAIFLPAGEKRYVQVKSSDTLSAILASTGGILNLVFWT